MPSVLWRCWLGGRKGIRNRVVGCWHGYLYGARFRVCHLKAFSFESKDKQTDCCSCRVHLWAACFQPFSGNISAECNRCSPPSSLVCGQLLTVCNIVWRLPQGQMSVAARPHFFDRIHSCLAWSGSDLEVSIDVKIDGILVAGWWGQIN